MIFFFFYWHHKVPLLVPLPSPLSPSLLCQLWSAPPVSFLPVISNFVAPLSVHFYSISPFLTHIQTDWIFFFFFFFFGVVRQPRYIICTYITSVAAETATSMSAVPKIRV